MTDPPSLKYAAVTLLFAAVAASPIIWLAVEDPGINTFGGDDSFGDRPEQEYNVTCYKWVENGTAQVICPDTVYAPNSVVNITVKECSEYRYASDEPHPCPHYRNG